ncbi:hypothetical protein TEA_002784 [Camellia sinensis var. sinensis]|uniref:Uncharacterized protein n=1 Tax=Camellia sinensis var. sinensis TaxID=542762 RepID=A0A4S4DEW8_CAMSN|nr:hypothetical protein TEA_002784 [Camellia sinensis var. sinensis]
MRAPVQQSKIRIVIISLAIFSKFEGTKMVALEEEIKREEYTRQIKEDKDAAEREREREEEAIDRDREGEKVRERARRSRRATGSSKSKGMEVAGESTGLDRSHGGRRRVDWTGSKSRTCELIPMYVFDAAIGFNVETVQYNNIKFQVWDLGMIQASRCPMSWSRPLSKIDWNTPCLKGELDNCLEEPLNSSLYSLW